MGAVVVGRFRQVGLAAGLRATGLGAATEAFGAADLGVGDTFAADRDGAALGAAAACGWDAAPSQENCQSRPSTAAIRPRTNSQMRSASPSVPLSTWPSTWTATTR